MKEFVKLLIEEKGIRSTPSIYISIILAYLEMLNWDEAAYIVTCMQNLEMAVEEEGAFLYLRNIILQKDESALKSLLVYLYPKVDSTSKNDIIN